jgi:diguanylate cyclase (GGDEF)-like protein
MKKIPLIIITISTLSSVATFITSNSEISFEQKTILFSILLSINFSALWFFYFKSYPADAKNAAAQTDSQLVIGELDEKLALLQEVEELFGGSLNSADMFRLIASRINEIVPFSSCGLFILDEARTHFNITNTVGENADKLLKLSQRADEGLAGKTLANRTATLDTARETDKAVLPYQVLKNIGCSIGVPLFCRNEVYGVLVFYHTKAKFYDQNSLFLAETISGRVSNTFQRSMNNDRSTLTALTDTLTHLPNERAFYMLLEQQIAEAQRFMERRPLTILAVDLQNFTEINKKYGHIQGDQVLLFVGKLIKNQLRQMDILARIISDEFFIILPTASEETTNQVVQRLYYTISNTPFVFADQTKVVIKLNFSAATFMKDGDTAEEMVKSAMRKKEVEKSEEKSTVVKFPDRFKKNAS